MRSYRSHAAGRRALGDIASIGTCSRAPLCAAVIHAGFIMLLASLLLSMTAPAVFSQPRPAYRLHHDSIPQHQPSPPPLRVTATCLDSLLARALTVSPQLRAARARVTAVRAQVTPAGLRPDPMLMAGIQNFPVSQPGFSDVMTMKMIGVSQTLPYPGKLGLQRRVAERETEGTVATLTDVTRQVLYDVRAAYYELVFLDHALEIVQRNADVLGNLIHMTETRYSVGTAGQSDVLKARVEAARLAETAVTLTTQRRAALARLNAVLDQPSDTPIEPPTLPVAITRAAVADSASDIRFLSPALGALAADSPLPSLDSLQTLALGGSAMLQAHVAMIAAQQARVDLARKAALPDIDVSLQYGQRQAQSDMVSAVVSVPLPWHKRQKQDALTTSANANLLALDAEHIAMQNDLRAEVAQLYTTAERQRTQLALYVKAILPQGRAALASATTSYQVGRVELLTVLDNQATLFTTETDYFRVLTDFATTIAQLERITGTEILQ